MDVWMLMLMVHASNVMKDSGATKIMVNSSVLMSVLQISSQTLALTGAYHVTLTAKSAHLSIAMVVMVSLLLILQARKSVSTNALRLTMPLMAGAKNVLKIVFLAQMETLARLVTTSTD